MNSNTNLNKAQQVKNDEFYTQYEDIEKELIHYKEHFKGKIVYCNCDDVDKSQFVKFFRDKFERYGLNKLIVTGYKINKATIFTNTDSYTEQIISTDEEYPVVGDFRSKDCIELLEQSDIVVGNPPFSLFRPFVAMLEQYQKKFLIIGNKNAIAYKNFFPLIRDNKVWIGYNNVHNFLQPDGTIKKFGNIGWYTNLDIPKRHDKLVLTKHFNKEDYKIFDNYPAFNVDKVSDIPIERDFIMEVTPEEYQRMVDMGFNIEILKW